MPLTITRGRSHIFEMETARNLLASILLRQIWPMVDHYNSNQFPNLHLSVTLKLIAFTLACHDKDANSLLCIAVESELPKIIITGTNLSEIPERYQLSRNFQSHQNSTESVPPIGALRLSPHAENSFIDLHNPSILDDRTVRSEHFQLNAGFKRAQFRTRVQFPYNMNPQRVHHIVIGTRVRFLDFFRLESVKVLKYKTGIVLDSSQKPRSPEILVERF